MKKELLKKIIENRRESMNASKKMVGALELYSDDHVSFSDQHLTKIVRDVLWEEYNKGWAEMIYYYLLKWIHYVIDWDKVEPYSEWVVCLMWWAKNNPDKVKEIITDDDRFISYFIEQYEN